MSTTTVDSNNNEEKYTSAIDGGAFVTTGNTLEVPPKETLYKTISSYVEEQGNLEISVGTSKVNENGTLEFKDGTIIVMVNPKAYQALAEHRKQRKEQSDKISSKLVKAAKEGQEHGE